MTSYRRLLLVVFVAYACDSTSAPVDFSTPARSVEALTAGQRPSLFRAAPSHRQRHVSVRERDLTARLLKLLPEGHLRDYVDASLSGRAGMTTGLTIEGIPGAQELVDSIMAERRLVFERRRIRAIR